MPRTLALSTKIARRSTTLGFAVFSSFALSIAALEILDRSNPLRWLSYAVPVVALIASVKSQRVRFSVPAFVAVVYSIVFILSVTINIDGIDLFYVGRDAVIYSLIFAALFLRLPITNAQILLPMCCTFVLVFTYLILGTQMAVSLVYTDQTFRGESSASIVYAALAIFFLINRQRRFAMLSFIFAIFTFKRTSYVYFFSALAYWSIVELTILVVGEKYRNICIGLSIVALYSACFALSFYILETLTFIQMTFFPYVRVNEFTSGRSGLYFMMMSIYRNSDLLHIIFGYGPGYIEKLLQQEFNIGLAHNEFLHHFFDYGLLGILFFGVLILAIVKIRIKYYPIAAYLLLASLTDNPVYVFIISIPIICLFSMEIYDSEGIHANIPNIRGRFERG